MKLFFINNNDGNIIVLFGTLLQNNYINIYTININLNIFLKFNIYILIICLSITTNPKFNKFICN